MTFESKNFFKNIYRNNDVILRPVKRSDVNKIFKLVSQSDLYKFTFIPKQYSLQIAQDWVARQIKFPQVLLIESSKHSEIVGVIGIVVDDSKKHHWEIAYWLGKKFRGKGYMREALVLFLQQVKKYTPIKKISARVFIKNNSSIKLLKSSNFFQEGLLHNHFYHNKKMKSVIMFGYCIK